MPTTRGRIHLEELELWARIGVPEEERLAPQRLTAHITVELARPMEEVGDDIVRTVDYARLATELRQMVAEREDRLVETLATAMAQHIAGQRLVAHVRVELRKYVLPGTKYAAVIAEL